MRNSCSATNIRSLPSLLSVDVSGIGRGGVRDELVDVLHESEKGDLVVDHFGQLLLSINKQIEFIKVIASI